MLQRCICFVVLWILVPATGAQPPGQGAVDLLGDPLPEGAIARLGTLRLKHGAVVESMAFSPDGHILASKSGKSIGSIRLWEVATGKQLPGPWNNAAKSFSAFAFSHDGSRIAAANATATDNVKDRGIIVWHIATGLALKVLPGKADFVQALAFTTDDKTLVAAGPEGVCWWNLASGTEIRVWQPLERENQSAKSRGAPAKRIFNSWLSSDGKSLALAVATNPMQLAMGTIPMRLIPREDRGSATLGIAWPGSVEWFGFNLVTCVEAWRSALDAENMGQLAFAFSPDGKRLIYSEQKDTLAVRDAISGESIAHARASGDAQPATTAPTRLARFEFGFGAGILRGNGGTSMLPSSSSQLAVSRNPAITASIGSKGHVFIRHQKTPADSMRTIPPRAAGWPNDFASAVALSADGKSIAVAAGFCLSVFDVVTLKERTSLEGNCRAVDLVEFSADGKRLITANSRAVVGPGNPVTWSTSTWKALPAMEVPANVPPGGIGSLDGRIYLAINGEERRTIYNMATGKSVARLDADVAAALDESAKGINGFTVPLTTGSRATAFFSTANRHFVLFDKDYFGMPSYLVCSASSGKLLGTFPAPGRAAQLLRPLAFSGDGRLVGCFSPADDEIQVFDMEKGKTIYRLRNLQEEDWTGGAVQLAFDHDGKFLAAWCARDGSVRVWDLATGKHKIIMVNVGETSGVGILLWSPDGRSLAVAGRKVQIWELASLKVRREIFVYANAMDFSPNGRFLATAGTDSTVLVWDLWHYKGP